MSLYHSFFEMTAFIYDDIVKTEVGLPFISNQWKDLENNVVVTDHCTIYNI
jgi:hypothetical protein